ncbi:VTC domain-containing protein, partial [Neocallimastix sp. 'constans']
STEYQNAVINKGLKPVLRTFYNRIAFQYPDHARIRISLDTDLCMIREDNFGRPRSKENWRREDVKTDYPFDYLPDEDITRFPFGILEIKLQTQYGVKAPQWIEDLINSHLVEQVPKFSKFVHGVSVLNKDRVPLLPYWLPELDILEKKEKEKMINGKKNKNLNGNISLNVSIERKKKIEYCEPSPNKLANN